MGRGSPGCLPAESWPSTRRGRKKGLQIQVLRKGKPAGLQRPCHTQRAHARCAPGSATTWRPQFQRCWGCQRGAPVAGGKGNLKCTQSMPNKYERLPRQTRDTPCAVPTAATSCYSRCEWQARHPECRPAAPGAGLCNRWIQTTCSRVEGGEECGLGWRFVGVG